MIYAIGDIHGCADELRLLIDELSITPDTTIVFLGDYIDRGPNSRDVVDIVLGLRAQCKVVALRGNHESMFLEFLEDPTSEFAGSFIYNGGSATLASYANAYGEVSIPDAHMVFFHELPVIYKTNEHAFVHAGLPDIPIEQISVEEWEHEMLWTRRDFLESSFSWSRTVVHGHTPVRSVTRTPTRINLDTGCVFNGRLTAMAFPGEEVFSVPRQTETESAMLRDNRDRRAAVRFEGKVTVQVMRGAQTYRFETIDFSQIGMLLRSPDDPTRQFFHAGEIINGVIGINRTTQVSFCGRVVRCKTTKNGLYFGVHILKTMPVEKLETELREPPSSSL